MLLSHSDQRSPLFDDSNEYLGVHVTTEGSTMRLLIVSVLGLQVKCVLISCEGGGKTRCSGQRWATVSMQNKNEL